jgi:hypothetical protein
MIVKGGEEIEFAINIPTLTDGTNNYVLRLGLCETVGADCVDGVYFEYNRAISTTKWVMSTANGGTRTQTASASGAAEATVATGWHRYKIAINSAANSVEYFVDGVSIGTVTTNIPTTNTTQPEFDMTKTLGSASRTMRVDYFQLRNSYTTQR